jgi:hypothetical protein
MSIKTLAPAAFTEDEQALIVTDLLALKKTQIGAFLSDNGFPKSGTKEELRARIEQSLAEGKLSLATIVQYLDDVIPWGKQHVYLYTGPQVSIDRWKKTDWMAKLLKKHRLGKYLNASLPLALPKKMKISSILHDATCLRVTAVKRRDWWERNEQYDAATSTSEGDDVQLRAFVHRVTRSLVAFEWNLVTNTAFLQISQLPTGFDYAEVAKEFFELVEAWLDIATFSAVDLRLPIKKLHELEETGAGETRSHGINYRTLQGRHLEAKSASATDPLLGDTAIDTALSAVRKTGVGHLGNFYWLSNQFVSPVPNPLDAEMHVIIVGAKNRINFPTPNLEQTIRYVLSRIRLHSA